MCPRRFASLCATLALIAVMLAWHFDAQAGDKSDPKVKAKATATKVGPDSKQTVTITLEIEEGWYIYANPVGAKDYEPNRTRVSFKAKEKSTENVKYPAGKAKVEKDGNETIEYRIYTGRVTLEAQVQRSAGDASPLQVSIEINCCKLPNKDGRGALCLPTQTVKLTVP